MGQLRKRGKFWWAIAMLASAAACSGSQPTDESRLPHCPGLVLGSNMDDEVIRRHARAR